MPHQTTINIVSTWIAKARNSDSSYWVLISYDIYTYSYNLFQDAFIHKVKDYVSRYAKRWKRSILGKVFYSGTRAHSVLCRVVAPHTINVWRHYSSHANSVRTVCCHSAFGCKTFYVKGTTYVLNARCKTFAWGSNLSRFYKRCRCVVQCVLCLCSPIQLHA